MSDYGLQLTVLVLLYCFSSKTERRPFPAIPSGKMVASTYAFLRVASRVPASKWVKLKCALIRKSYLHFDCNPRNPRFYYSILSLSEVTPITEKISSVSEIPP